MPLGMILPDDRPDEGDERLALISTEGNHEERDLREADDPDFIRDWHRFEVEPERRASFECDESPFKGGAL